MSFLNSSIIDSDTELSNFADALASPARVAIVRFIAANNNAITPEDFGSISLAPETINEQVTELKNLGILNVKKHNDGFAYSIDQGLFNQMANKYAELIESINSLRACI
jgi:predicted transcriptional regulator